LKDVGKPAQAREVEKPKRKFKDLSLVEQCAIRCEDERMRQFLAARFHCFVRDDNEATETIRKYLGVSSRSELGKGNHDADNKWRALETQFQAWLLDERYADVRR